MIFKTIPLPKAVVFDLDGTLYPYNADYTKACLHALARVTRFAVADRFNGKVGMAQAFAQEHGLHAPHAPHDIARMLDKARHALTVDFIRPAPALAQHIRQLGIPACVLSNSAPVWIEAALHKRGLEQAIAPQRRFSARADFGLSKRYPETYRRLAEKLHVKDPAQIMLFDDEPANLLAAASAGLTTILIRKDARPAPDGICAAGPDVKSMLNQLFPLPQPLPPVRP